MALQTVIDWLDDRIVERPGRVVLAFLAVTAVLAVGLGDVSTETGTEQFTTGVPEEAAFEAVTEEFTPPFEPEGGTTQVIQSGANVLSKPGLLRMLELEERLADRPGLRVADSRSAAQLVAAELDPTASTPEARVRTVERATRAEVAAAVRAAADRPGFTRLVSEDFNRRDASASATVAVVEHDLPTDLGAGTGQGGTSPLTPIQREAQELADSVGGDIRVFGAGIVADEFSNVVTDSLFVVVPAAVVLIVAFLVVAYRDLVDLLLGVVALAMTILWTFGFLGWAGIPFSQFLIAVPPLLLAVGIDFGIHAINRYREERADGLALEPAMRRTTDQLLVAFGIVTATTVIGFSANLASQLVPIREFGLVASVGIVFTMLIFGVFVPAAKVGVDRLRERYPVPTFSQAPLGTGGGLLGRGLSVGVWIARRGPAVFLLFVLAGSAVAGYYATDLDTSFSDEDFLPPEETPDYLRDLPEPFRPGEYTISAQIAFLEEKFQTAEGETATVYVEGPMTQDQALEALWRAGEDPPETFVRDGRHAESQSIVEVIRGQAAVDPEFRALVARNDRNANGIPDDDLREVYESLLASPARGAALEYLAEDYRSARVVYTVEADADPADVTADARAVADRQRFHATATGEIVVFQAIAGLIFRSAITSLSLALAGTAVFLVAVYWALEGRPSLGVANLVPIVVTIAFLAGTMRFLGLAFNAFSATVLAITIGLGVDYSVHVVHRYADERREAGGAAALERTVRGTGGALAGSMLTTAGGIGVLVLAVFPAIGQFGLLTALSVVYSFLASLLVLPSTLVLWERYQGGGGVVAGLRRVVSGRGVGVEGVVEGSEVD